MSERKVFTREDFPNLPILPDENFKRQSLPVLAIAQITERVMHSERQSLVYVGGIDISYLCGGSAEYALVVSKEASKDLDTGQVMRSEREILFDKLLDYVPLVEATRSPIELKEEYVPEHEREYVPSSRAKLWRHAAEVVDEKHN